MKGCEGPGRGRADQGSPERASGVGRPGRHLQPDGECVAPQSRAGVRRSEDRGQQCAGGRPRESPPSGCSRAPSWRPGSVRRRRGRRPAVGPATFRERLARCNNFAGPGPRSPPRSSLSPVEQPPGPKASPGKGSEAKNSPVRGSAAATGAALPSPWSPPSRAATGARPAHTAQHAATPATPPPARPRPRPRPLPAGVRAAWPMEKRHEERRRRGAGDCGGGGTTHPWVSASGLAKRLGPGFQNRRD